MREIKFRAWDKYSKEMEYIKDFYWFEEMSVHDPNDNSIYEISQFTGLVDDNGKDIYFDDIVSFCFHDKDHPEDDLVGTALITETIGYGVGILFNYRDQLSSVVWAVDQGGVVNEIWEDSELWSIDVIGNIYQNPDLIKNDIT